MSAYALPSLTAGRQCCPIVISSCYRDSEGQWNAPASRRNLGLRKTRVCLSPLKLKQIWLTGKDYPLRQSSASFALQQQYSAFNNGRGVIGFGIRRERRGSWSLRQNNVAGRAWGLTTSSHGGSGGSEGYNAGFEDAGNGSSRSHNGASARKATKRRWSDDGNDSAHSDIEHLTNPDSAEKLPKKQRALSPSKVAWFVGAFVLATAVAFAHRKAKHHLSSNVLPPLAAMVSEQLGREIELGKVRRLSPLGITLGPCSVGPEEEEFSCAEVAEVEVKFRPITSLRKGQLVLDAVVNKPRALVSQLPDWTWLEIPTEMDEHVKRTSADSGLDERTVIRRKSREQGLLELSGERTDLARLGAERRYRISPGEVLRGEDELREQMGMMKTVKGAGENRVEREIVTDGGSPGIEVEMEEGEGDGGNNGEEELEAGGYQRLMKAGGKWMRGNMLDPAAVSFKAVLERMQPQKAEPSKAEAIDRLLDRSAAAVLRKFVKLEAEQKQFLDDFNSHAHIGADEGSFKGGSSKDEGGFFSDYGSNNEGPIAESRAQIMPVEPGLREQMHEGVSQSGVSRGERRLTAGESAETRSWRSEREVTSRDSKSALHVEPASIESIREALVRAIQERSNGSHQEGGKGSQFGGGMVRAIEGGKGRRGGSSNGNVNAEEMRAPGSGGSRLGGALLLGSDMSNNRSEEQVRNRLSDEGGNVNGRSGDRRRQAQEVSSFIRGSVKELKVTERLMSSSEKFANKVESGESGQAKEKVNSKTTQSHLRKGDGEGKGGRKGIAQTGPRLSEVSDKNSAEALNSAPVGVKGNVISGITLAGIGRQAEGPVGGVVRIEGQQAVGGDASGSLNVDSQGVLTSQSKGKKGKGSSKLGKPVKGKKAESWSPVALERVFINEGTLVLVGHGDVEPRFMDETNGYVTLSKNYRCCHVAIRGNLKEWRTGNPSGDGGRLNVKVDADLDKKSWTVSIRGRNLFAPLFERLLEIPLDWYKGRADGDLLIWMNAEDTFPHLRGRVDVHDLDFQIWESPSPFMGVNGALLFEGQRMFFHDATGHYGHVPLNVSGDMDINPVNGEYRLSAQASPVELNSLMHTLGAKPPPYPLAGAVKGVVYCRGPLDIPIFEGTVEMSSSHVPLALSSTPTDATRAIELAADKGAVAAYDKVPFTSASGSFIFRTDDCVADVFGIRVVPVGGGEIRAAGDLWVCPEGEEDPHSVNVDCWAFGIPTENLLQWYAPTGFDVPPGSIGVTHGEAKARGALLMPTIDVVWTAPDARGSLEGAHGKVAISREAISVNSSASTFDLFGKVDTAYPPLPPRPTRSERKAFRLMGPVSASGRPTIEGLELDLHLKGFDVMGLAFGDSQLRSDNLSPVRAKVAGKVKLKGRVPSEKVNKVEARSQMGTKLSGKILGGEGERSERGKLKKKGEKNGAGEGSLVGVRLGGEERDGGSREEGDIPKKGFPGLMGEISMQGLKLNQLLVGSNLQGHFQVLESGFELQTKGRPDEHLAVQVAKCEGREGRGVGGVGVGEIGGMLSLQRGALRTEVQFQPGVAADVQVRNLTLDELEVASLRGEVEKVDVRLDFGKRRGSGGMLMLRPRFSGLHSESLEANFRWTGDVISLERSVLEQANSRYVLEGEYVLPGLRDRAALEDKQEEDKLLGKAMAGQLRSMMSSMGRWRLKLDVPRAEIAEMLPAARLLSRNRDPAVVFRSKEMFVNGVQNVGFVANSLSQQLEYFRHRKPIAEAAEAEVGEPAEATALPGLAELRGQWHGTVSASGGGNGDTKADFDLQGHNWEWGAYSMQEVEVSGDYSNHQGLRLEKLFIRHNQATLHMEGTPMGPAPNLHFAVLHFPANLVPPVLQAMKSESTQEGSQQEHMPPPAPIKGIIFVEGDYKGRWPKPQCEVTVQLLDGAIGGVSLERAEVAASITSSSRLAFHSYLKPADIGGQVRVKGNIPFTLTEEEEMEGDRWVEGSEERTAVATERDSDWEREKEREREREWESEIEGEDDERRDEIREAREGVKLLLESARALDRGDLGKGAVEIDVEVKDGGMRLLTALSPGLQWLQGSAEVMAQVRGTFYSPDITGVATLNRVAISSPVLPRPLTNLGGTIRVRENQLYVEELEGRLGRAGVLVVKGQLPFKPREEPNIGDGITIKADALEVRARNVFSGQVDSQLLVMGSLKEPEVTGIINLSRGNVYLSQENTVNNDAPSAAVGSHGWTAAQGNAAEEVEEAELEAADEERKVPVAVRLRGLKLHLGPELRIVYPLILNFATSGELEVNGYADPRQVKPRGTLAFESGDVNLVATQVRLDRDHKNRVKFEPEQGLDPTLDLKLVGNDFQLRIQGRATKWQDNVVIAGIGEEQSLSTTEASEKFEAKLKESVLEADGQLAFRKLAAATVETLMPKIETQGEFGQARWRLVSAPQIPNLLSLDPTTDPFKSLANLSFGTEVEIQFGKKVQASVVRQLKESEMATQWTLLYHLNNKLRVLYSFVPSISPYRLFFEAHTDHEWGPEKLIDSSRKVVKKIWSGNLK